MVQYFKDVPCRVDCVDILELAVEKLKENAQRFGVENAICGLDGGNYMVTFPKESSHIWEDFIAGHLQLGYSNEYLTEFGVVFLFYLENGIERYEVYDYNNDEVLHLCEKLCECHFDSLYQMLIGNHYYREIIGS